MALKRSFLFPLTGARRQLGLLLPGEFLPGYPIHCWAVEHDGQLLLVDTGETAHARDIPFAKFSIDTELPGALAAAGLSIDDV